VAAAFRPKLDLKKVRWTAIKEIVGLFPERVAGLRRAQPASLKRFATNELVPVDLQAMAAALSSHG